MCDISESISCSKVLTSKWSRGFGKVFVCLLVSPNPFFYLANIDASFSFPFSGLLGGVLGEESYYNAPNALLGLAYYLGVLLVAVLNIRSTTLQYLLFLASLVAGAASLYLGGFQAPIAGSLHVAHQPYLPFHLHSLHSGFRTS